MRNIIYEDEPIPSHRESLLVSDLYLHLIALGRILSSMNPSYARGLVLCKSSQHFAQQP